MKMGRRFLLLLALSAGPVLGQQSGTEISATATNSAALRDDWKLLAPLIEEPKPSRDVIAGKKLELSGRWCIPSRSEKYGESPDACCT
jgi:hypothetical protein